MNPTTKNETYPTTKSYDLQCNPHDKTGGKRGNNVARKTNQIKQDISHEPCIHTN